MTIESWLKEAIVLLKANDVESARLDAEILLADELKRDRSWLHTNPEHILQGASLQILDQYILRRSMHEPLAYIRGKQEFYGRDFIVTKDTLTPRPETETMVELAIDVMEDELIVSVADLGTGSGCIIASLYLESFASDTVFTGYDISEPALEVAKKNASLLNADVTFTKDDMTLPMEHEWQNAEIILANLPYVPDGYEINRAAMHEPKVALFAGDDGLDFYRVLFKKATGTTKHILTESLEFQHEELEKIAHDSGFMVFKTKDLIQVYSKKIK